MPRSLEKVLPVLHRIWRAPEEDLVASQDRRHQESCRQSGASVQYHHDVSEEPSGSVWLNQSFRVWLSQTIPPPPRSHLLAS